MSNLKNRINQILENSKLVNNSNYASGDVEFAVSSKRKKNNLIGSGCCGCKCGGQKMPDYEYSMPDNKSSSVDEQLEYAIGNDALDGNVKQNMKVERAGKGMVYGGMKVKKGMHRMPDGRVMKDSDHMTGGKKPLSQGLQKYQRNVKRLMNYGYTRKEAQNLLKELKKGDGFFGDVFDGIKDVASVAAPFLPLLL